MMDDMQKILEIKCCSIEKSMKQILLAVIGSANRETFILIEQSKYLQYITECEYIKYMTMKSEIQKAMKIKLSLTKIRVQKLMDVNGSSASEESITMLGSPSTEAISYLCKLCKHNTENQQTRRELKCRIRKRDSMRKLLAIIGSANRETSLVARKVYPQRMLEQCKCKKCMYMNCTYETLEKKCSLTKPRVQIPRSDGSSASNEPSSVPCNEYSKRDLCEQQRYSMEDEQITLKLKCSTYEKVRLQTPLAIMSSANSETQLKVYKHCLQSILEQSQYIYMMNSM